MNRHKDVCQRIFLGWDRPLLLAAEQRCRQLSAESTDHLSGRHTDFSAGNLDPAWLETCLFVFPTRRGNERFRERLLAAGGDDITNDVLQTVVLGALPERLYQAERKLASPRERALVWGQCLADASDGQKRWLSPRGQWRDDDPAHLDGLVRWIESLNAEVHSAAANFSDVANFVDDADTRARWQVLVELHKTYLQRLADMGLADLHQQRQAAIDARRCHSRREVILVGCSDLPKITTALLGHIDATVEAWIAAPGEYAGRFDAFGNVLAGAWDNVTESLPPDCLRRAEDVADQASRAAEQISRWQTSDPRLSIAFGVTDESQVPAAEFALLGRHLHPRRNLGYTVAETAPGRLLRLLGDHVSRRSWESLAGLVRHPWVLRYFFGDDAQQQDACLAELDALRSGAFPVQIDAKLPPRTTRDFPIAAKLPADIDAWLRPLAAKTAKTSRHCEAIGKCLRELPPAPEQHWRSHAALAQIDGWLREQADVHPQLDPPEAIEDVLRGVIEACGRLRIGDRQPPSGDTTAEVPILGWLDLALDDSDAIVVMGLNHPFVPAAAANEPLLPASLRAQFGINDSEKRFARDAHALACMWHARSAIQFFVGKTSADGNPTPPSRLLATANADIVAQRIRSLVGKNEHVAAPEQQIGVAAGDTFAHRWITTPSTGAITVPELDIARGQAVEQMSVTAFKNYLTCPYRFYLRHVLHIKPLDDQADELAANQFGDLIHNALEDFGKDESRRRLTDLSAITSALQDAIDQRAQSTYGRGASAAVQMQIALAKQRILAVAKAQAKRIADGWQIVQAEAAVDEDVAYVMVDGKRMGLRGRFDRIDFHPATGRYAILDYKTHGHPPEKKHLGKDADGNEVWIDLQLPLYRRMIPFLSGVDADPSLVEVGYFNIGETDAETRINLAEFTTDQWRLADRQIDRVIRSIWAGHFDPVDPPPKYDDYEMILHTSN
ncbi:MAG: PD-(D/E)XK nuclease family protein [Planctomycetota bacterium]